jgi:CSLREA domain-containing protein
LSYWVGWGRESQAAPLAVITVNTLEDELNADEDCSLREAIEAANSNAQVDACVEGNAVLTDTIGFEVNGTIVLTDQLSVIAGGPLVIDAGGVITVSGNYNSRVLFANNADLSILGMNVINGTTTEGSGLYSAYGVIRTDNSTFSGNSAAYNGGDLCHIWRIQHLKQHLLRQ